jgi:hypothetical protein
MRLSILGSAAFMLVGSIAQAQVGAPTTVQLPTVQVFSVSTTVSVPDGGGVLLGGINRASDSSVTRGIPFASKIPGLGPLGANRGIASTRSAANMSVHATIIDHQELDAAVLAQAAARRSLPAPDARAVATHQKADFISRNLAQAPRPAEALVSKAEPSVEEIRRRNELAAADRSAEADGYYAKGVDAEAAGKPNIAKIHYQMAARRATGELKGQIDLRLAALQSPGKSTIAGK